MTPPVGASSGSPVPQIPLRGEVWDAFFPPPLGDHPVVVLTTNALIPRMSAITVAVVTGTEGPDVTHVALDAEAGVTTYQVSWVSVTDLHTVPTSRLRRRRGLLSPGEVDRVEASLRAVLVL